MTTTLTFDTSQQWCCVAVSKDGEVLAHNSVHLPSGHSQQLLPQILNTLQEASIDLSDIDKIVTVTGPGSFTGLRVSIATAQGLGLVLAKPIVGVNTFTAYAACVKADKETISKPHLTSLHVDEGDKYCFSVPLTPPLRSGPLPQGERLDAALNWSHKDILVVIDSQKQDIYCQLFSAKHQPLKEPRSLSPADIASYMGDKPFILTGTATAAVSPILLDQNLCFEILNLTPGQVCLNLSGGPEYTSSTTIQPFYLKEAIAHKSM